MPSTTTVSVKILEKEFQVSCPDDEVDELAASARYLDAQMRAIRDTGKVLGMDRMAVMAALNIGHDLLRLRNEQTGESNRLARQARDLTQRVERALDDARQTNP